MDDAKHRRSFFLLTTSTRKERMDQIISCFFLLAVFVFLSGFIGFARDATKGMDDL